jgi:chorismate mutase
LRVNATPRRIGKVRWRLVEVDGSVGREDVTGVPVRAVRGATQVSADDRDAVIAGTAELVRAVLDRNEIDPADLISVIFTATPDLTAEFPAYAARAIGITDVPLLCATEIDVPGAMPRVIRLLAHVESGRPRGDFHHVYLHGAAQLRTDLPR